MGWTMSMSPKLNVSTKLAAADQADANPLDRERDLSHVDDDRLEVRIFRRKHDLPATPPETLHRDLVIDASDDDLTRRRVRGLVHNEEIAVEDAGASHAAAA